MLPNEDNERAYHPDMKEDTPENGLICFLNHERPCGADCMAFTTDKPASQEYVGQWSNCRVLTSLHQGAKHLTILAHAGGQLVKGQVDNNRRNQSTPPAPYVPPVNRGPQ